jgi:HAD superfamily hydrolase (TIGR01509 family)
MTSKTEKKRSESEKTLILDLGNILVQLNPLSGIWTGHNQSGTQDGTDENLMRNEEKWSQSQAVMKYETGQIKQLETFYLNAVHELDLRVDKNKFIDIYNGAIGQPFPETLSILNALRRRFPLFLLSNTSPAHWNICQEQWQADDFFEKVFLSFELGVMKPDERIFTLVLAQINTCSKTIWFFDDRIENVNMARKKGINAYQSFGGKTLINDLQKHGFL